MARLCAAKEAIEVASDKVKIGRFKRSTGSSGAACRNCLRTNTTPNAAAAISSPTGIATLCFWLRPSTPAIGTLMRKSQRHDATDRIAAATVGLPADETATTTATLPTPTPNRDDG